MTLQGRTEKIKDGIELWLRPAGLGLQACARRWAGFPADNQVAATMLDSHHKWPPVTLPGPSRSETPPGKGLPSPVVPSAVRGAIGTLAQEAVD